MKILGKKYGISACVLFIGAITIGLCFSMILLNNRRKQELEFNSRGFYNEYAAKFMITDMASEERFKSALKSTVKNGVVYLKNLDLLNSLQGVWFQGEVVKPELQSGRFFEEEDFLGDTKYAVIGASYLEDIEEQEGKKYIEIEEENYEVIGVLKAKADTKLGQMIFINWNAAIKQYGISGDYLLDGASEEYVEETIEVLESKMYSDEIYYQEKLMEDTSVVRIFGLETLDAIYLIMFINFIICGIFITMYWLQKQKKHIEVYGLLGIGRKYLFLDMLKGYIKIVIPGILIGVVYFLVKEGGM